MPSGLLRDILVDSGIFVYSKNSLVYTYVNSKSIGVYNATGKDAEIYLNEDGVYSDLISGGELRCENGTLKIKNREINAFLLIKKQECQFYEQSSICDSRYGRKRTCLRGAICKGGL